MHRQVAMDDEPMAVLSEFAALPSGRDSKDRREHRNEGRIPPSRNRGSRRFQRRSQTPRNQVDRQIVFSENPSIQALRDILVTFHDDPSPQAIINAHQLFHQLPDNRNDSLDDFATVFVKAFSTLSIEIPSVVTFVALVTSSQENFTQTVLHKMELAFIEALQNGCRGVFTAKLLLRSFACFGCCGVLALTGEGSMMSLLQPYIECIVSTDNHFTSSMKAIAAYLLASTIPFIAEKLMEEHIEFLHSSALALETYLTTWTSDFDIDRRRAIFQVFFYLRLFIYFISTGECNGIIGWT